MTDDEREYLLDDADAWMAQALADLSVANGLALEAEEWSLATDIHQAMQVLEGMLGFVPAPQPTHQATEAMQ